MKRWILILFALFLVFAPLKAVWAAPQAAGVSALPSLNLDIDLDDFGKPEKLSGSILTLIFIASIGFIPFILVSTTSFLRIIIVFSMLRNALQTQQSPPNPILISLALFMTIFVMSPVWMDVYQTAIVPYQKKAISQEQAFKTGVLPLRRFMLKFTREKDLGLFIEFAHLKPLKSIDEVPTVVIIPAFIISELKTAFQIAFLIYIPFVVIDLVVSNILLSLGMFMLSPVMISMPFKILLFVLADGWYLITRGLLLSFQ